MTLYRRPKFLEILHEIREEMSREVDYDVDLFAEITRTGKTVKRNTDKKQSEKTQVNLTKIAETKISKS